MKNKFPFSDLFAGNDIAINKYLDAKINSAINAAINTAECEYVYTISDLDKNVNEEETLREYLMDGIKEFSLNISITDITNDKELNRLVNIVDDCWRGVLNV